MQIGVIPVTAFQQNCSVIHCEKTQRGAVVDPGGDLELVLEYIAKEGIEIEKILLTHAHIDHAGATKSWPKRLGRAGDRAAQGRRVPDSEPCKRRA